MTDSLVYKTERPWPNHRLKTAAIVGHTTMTSCRLWLRTACLGEFRLLLYPQVDEKDESFQTSLRKVLLKSADLPAGATEHPFTIEEYARDTTHVLDLQDLVPGQKYLYALWGTDPGGGEKVQRILLGQDREYSFRTLPDPDQPYTFAFLSCHMPYEETLFGDTRVVNMETWEALNIALSRHADENLRFVLAAGDQAYADGVDTLSIWKLLAKRMAKSGRGLLPSRDDMVSWYRDIYRGYWGFRPIQQVFSRYPTYMIWDDHEIGDGWGSYLKKELADQIKKRGWSVNERVALCERMFDVAKQVYHEYQHSHNPVTPPGQYDYTYSVGSSAFYVLDGRGYRDLRRRSYRILGKEQMERFVGWLEQLNDTTRFVFVVSAVPLLQLSAIAGRVASLKRSLLDDLRDSWEHPTHDDERKVLMDALFAAARRGIRVCVLSGDVHTAAVFRLQDRTRKHTIYQLTSSAITYNVGRVAGWLLALAAKGNGNTRDGYRFERLALYRRSNFAMVRVDPAKDRAEFRLYGQDLVSVGEDRDRRVPVQTRSRTEISGELLDEIPGGHSIATIPLEFT